MPARPPAKKLPWELQEPVVQQIVLDRSGQVLASDDLVFSTKKWGGGPAFGRLPFFEGIWHGLFFPKNRGAETVFNGIQMAVPELPGIYDLHFSPVFWNGQTALNCSIVDRTGHYLHRRELQQAEAETALTAEKAALAR